MRNKNKKTLILTVIICLLPMILGIVLYNKLPEQMPVHFTANDVPDNFAPKNLALFGIPIIMAIVQTICLIVTMKKMKFENNEKPKIAKIFEWVIPITTVLVYIIMINVALESRAYVKKSILLILGILFISIGNYMPKMSYEVGKTIIHPVPKSEKTFRKMTKIFGYSFMAIGMILLLLIVLG